MSQLNKSLTYGTAGGLFGLGHVRDSLKGVAKNATGKEQFAAVKDAIIAGGKNLFKVAPRKTVEFIKKSSDH